MSSSPRNFRDRSDNNRSRPDSGRRSEQRSDRTHGRRPDYRDRPQTDNRHPNAKRRDKDAKFPLDPSLLVQRGLQLAEGKPLPVAQLKSETKHPTVYRKRIAQVDQKAKHGDIVSVETVDGIPVGYGMWNPRAEATIRILSWDEPPITSDWWKDRFDMAVRLRRQLKLDKQTNAYRLVHAEGDFLPGIAVDVYNDMLVLEAFTLGMYQRAEAIAQSLAASLQLKHWVIKPGPYALEQEGFLVDGFSSPNAPAKVQIQEHGLTYELSPVEGHKTGFFCDQRENRLRLRDFCQGKSVLDLCSYSGGFSLNAAKAGASDVTAVDLDEDAIQYAKRNAQLNKLSSIKFVHADAFSYMRDMQRNGKTYDVVILDPPKLIRSREEAVEGQEKYFDMNKLAATLVVRGGLLVTCSCSGLFQMDEFVRTVRAAAGTKKPQLLMKTGAGMDHPVAMNCLESEYLKCQWLRF